MLEDRLLTCRDCQRQFMFTVGEQAFYIEKGLQNAPNRCPDCRARRRERLSSRETVTVACADCGGQASVPFVPRQDRPVFCDRCFELRRVRVPANLR